MKVKLQSRSQQLNLIDLLFLNDDESLLFLFSVFLGGLYYSLCELVSSELDQTDTLSLLLQDIKTKDVVSFLQLINEKG